MSRIIVLLSPKYYQINHAKEYVMENVLSLVTDHDQFAKHSGIELMEAAPGYARVKLEIKDYHFNGVKMVHGGAIFTLADYAFAVASNSHGRVAVGINAAISYVKAAKTGTLFAEAKEVSLNAKLGNYTINVTDDHDDLIAVFQGTVYRKKDEHHHK
jgi:acyl-CoA thioesterase